MKKEIDLAVELFHKFGFKNVKHVSKSCLEGFTLSLTSLLVARFEGHWYPDTPKKGNGYRCIRLNGQCSEPMIIKSLETSGINRSQLSELELSIWIDPGLVSYRIGEDGSIGVHFDIEEDSLQRSNSVDEDMLSVGSSDSEAEISSSATPSISSSPSPTRSLTTSSPVEFNPYKPSLHYSYPTHYQQMAPVHSSPIMPHAFHQQRRFTPSPKPSPQSVSSTPGSYSSLENSRSTPSYSRPRNLFPQDSGSYARGILPVNYQYAMSMAQNNQNQLDIPVMA